MNVNNVEFSKNLNILKNGKPTIALLLGSLTSSYFEGILQGASITAKAKGFNIITFSGGPFASPYPEAEARDKLFELLDTHLVDGVIVTLSSLSRYITTEETNRFIDALGDVPMVNISGIYDGVINIQADLEIGFDQLFDHYVNKHGFKRMAFFRGPKNHKTSESRMAIYKKMLEKYGLEYDESLVVYGDLRSDSAIEFVEEFFDRRQGECDAIISINDRSTIEIMNILQSRGISVPEDIAISGSMGVVEGLFTRPQLTTIYEPVFDIGAKAIETIADILSGKEVPDKIKVPTELIVRQSCGCGKIDITKKMWDLLHYKDNQKLPATESIYQSLEKYFLDELTTHLNLTSVAEIKILLQAYKKAITEGCYKQFLDTLREHLMLNLRGDDMAVWFAFTSAFLYSTIQLLTTQAYNDHLVQFTEALVVLCQEVQQGTINYKKYEANYYLNFIQDIGSNLNATFDLNTIKNYVINILETRNCYISRYMEDDQGNKISKNILAVHDKVQLDLKEDNQEFLPTRLIPQSVNLDDEIYNLIIFPLIARHEFIGYMVMDYMFKKGAAYENMQTIISSTMKNELQIQELIEAEARFSDIAHSTSDWLWEIDENSYFTYCSSSINEVTGFTSEQIVGKSIIDVAIPGKREYLDKISEQKVINDLEFISRDIMGKTIYLMMSATPIIKAGKYKGYRGVFKNITDQKQQEEQIKSLAYYDTLTGLPNRTMFIDKLEDKILTCEMTGEKFALLFIDIDRFKQINDTLGHNAGDIALQYAADSIKEAIGPNNILSRLGGDEFTVIVNEYKFDQDIVRLIQKIYDTLKKPISIKKREIYLAISVGIAMYPRDGKSRTELLKNSDIAMYKAKAQGRNRSVFFDSGVEEKNIDRKKQEELIRTALRNGMLCLEYQPQIDARTGGIIGVEALVRIRKEDGRLIYPNDFIRLAEDIGLIGEIDKWVLNAVCLQLKNWKAFGINDVKISVNLSPKELANKELSKQYMDIIEQYDIDRQMIQIEITENAIVENESMAYKIISDFKKYGLTIALDDFGVGYSSLNMLHLFPVDTLKIDQSFIKDLETNLKTQGIYQTIIYMADNLEMEVVAEGVETEEQYEIVKSFGCYSLQGYYFLKPVDIKVINKMIGKDI